MQIKPREVIVSLNPYSNGIYNLTPFKKEFICAGARTVLILILMEYTI